MSKRFFVTAIDTNVGKTHVAAILCKAWQADYWKPVQCGDLSNSDTQKVQRLAGAYGGCIHAEAFRLQAPMSPHAAAQLEGLVIELHALHLPNTSNHLLIEGAGGVMVPLNNRQTFLDILPNWNATTIIVSRNYLGSINHTLLTVSALRSRNIAIAGIIMVGEKNEASEQAIEAIGGVRILTHIPLTNSFDEGFVEEQAHRLQNELKELLTD